MQLQVFLLIQTNSTLDSYSILALEREHGLEYCPLMKAIGRYPQCGQNGNVSAEVLLAFERVMNLAGSVDLICAEVNRRLWEKEVVDPITGDTWEIKEVTPEGFLSLRKGSLSTVWTR